jgi:hypothetical protein
MQQLILQGITTRLPFDALVCAVFSKVKVTHVGRIKTRDVGPPRIWTCQRQVVWSKAVFEVFFQYRYEGNNKEQNFYSRFCLLVCDDVKPGKNITICWRIRLDSFPIATLKMETLLKYFVNCLPKYLVLLKMKHNLNVCSAISVLGSLMAKKLFGKIFFVN